MKQASVPRPDVNSPKRGKFNSLKGDWKLPPSIKKKEKILTTLWDNKLMSTNAS